MVQILRYSLHKNIFSVSKVLILIFILQFHPPLSLIFPFPILPFRAFTPLELLTGSSLFLPTLPSDLCHILYLLLPFSPFVIFQILPKYFSWKKPLDDMHHWTMEVINHQFKEDLAFNSCYLWQLCALQAPFLQLHYLVSIRAFSPFLKTNGTWASHLQQEKRQVFWPLPFK